MVTTETEILQRALQERLPPYAVVLFNDDHHSQEFVVEALIECVPSLVVDEAIGIMLEAHNTGSAVVIVCPLEEAELYYDRIQAYGLAAEIRKA